MSASTGFYEEQDQLPDVKRLREGELRCPTCLGLSSLGDHEPLSLSQCARCGNMSFVPYKVKDYWLYRPLGGGGMGSVYKAVRETDNALFAVKILPRANKDHFRLVAALNREGRIGTLLGDHPYICKVVEIGQWRDEHFMASVFCPGRRLDELIESTDPISPKYILLWCMQILAAEQYIYEKGYLYRDLKPQNIIIDPNGNAHLIDFGLCMDIELAATDASETVEGSPQYMPPERMAGSGESMASEIYSLGLVMFHSMSRKPYYTATTAFDLARKHVSSLHLSSVASRLPQNTNPDIIRLIDKMIMRSPKDRFQTYKEALTAINEVYKTLS